MGREVAIVALASFEAPFSSGIIAKTPQGMAIIAMVVELAGGHFVPFANATVGVINADDGLAHECLFVGFLMKEKSAVG